ncbi:hypothetical protein [Romboutsia sp.]|uniref:hypothetical protein n=1 Tax=Romboutsia sp. TaxID=1965302 RepID=UPI003F3C89E3
MNLVGIENITPYQDVYEFKVYEYDYELDLNNKESFICNLKVIVNRVESVFKNRIDRDMQILGLIKDLSSKVDKVSIREEIKELILNEILEENLEKENIDIMFIES